MTSRRSPIPSALLLLLTLAACSSRADRPPRLVVLYTACTVNKDLLEPYDPSVRSTPELAAFARDSVVFTRHTTEAGQSGIAYASIFCGVQADRHKAYRHPTRLPGYLYQISELFRDAGYTTYYYSGQPMAAYALHYGQGVEADHAFTHWVYAGDVYTATDDSFRSILAGLRDDPDSRAFVQVNLTLSHPPYQRYATEEVRREFLDRYPEAWPEGVTTEDFDRLLAVYAEESLNLQWDYEATIRELSESGRLLPGDEPKLHAIVGMLYRASLWRLDAAFGRLLRSIDEAGLRDESLVAFTADHGEILFRENALYEWTHGLQLAPEVLDVPWMIRAPCAGVAPGRYEAVSRSIDVYPTIAGLCGLAVPADAGVEGVDLSRAVLGKEPPLPLRAFSHTSTLGQSLVDQFEGWIPGRYYPRDDVRLVWVRVRDRDVVCKWRNVGEEEWGYELFDLAADPGEREDRFDPSDPEHAELAAALRAYKQRLVDGYASDRPPPLEVESERERLRALGYLGDADEEGK